MVKTPDFHGRGVGSIPGWGTKILHAVWHSQKNKIIKCLKKKSVNCVEVKKQTPVHWGEIARISFQKKA